MEYHHDRFMDYSLLVFKKETLVAVLPANKVDNTLFSHQGLSYGGLVFSEKLMFQNVVLIFKALFEFLKSENIKQVTIKQIPSIYCDVPNDEMPYLMSILNADLVRRDTLSVTKIERQVKWSKDRIAGVKRGKKHNLEVKEVDTFDDFWNTILIPNLALKHDVNPVHTLKEITLLKERFPKNIRQFNVYKDGKIIAGTTIFESEFVAHSQYISGNGDKNTLGSLDFLHAHLIKTVFKHKRFFDFGISNENNGKTINKGLQYWKEGFGARTVIQDFYGVKVENNKLLEHIWGS